MQETSEFAPSRLAPWYWYSHSPAEKIPGVTGPVTHNMKVALERTYAAMPAPKWVVAVGDCGCGCGVFEGSYAVVGAVDKVIPVDLRIKGCPPRPIELLKGLIALMEKATATP